MTINSYYGLLTQASHSHHARTRIAKAAMRRGLSIDYSLTKAYRRAA